MRSLISHRAILLLIAATAVTSILYRARMTPAEWHSSGLAALSSGTISEIGKVTDHSQVSLSGFAPVINKVELTFGPLPQEPTTQGGRVAYSVCGSAEKAIDVRNESIVLQRIPFACSPLNISLRPLAVANNSDTVAGAQIRRVRIISFLTPWPSVNSVLGMSAALGLLVILSCVACGGVTRRGQLLAYGLLACVTGFSLFTKLEPRKFEPLWLCVATLLAGGCLSRSRGSPPQGAQPMTRWIWCVVLIGAALRFYGINFGLPSNFHPDEVPKVNAIMRMVGQNTWNPQYFLHPSLLLYLTYFMNCFIRALGIDGTFRESAFLAGRLVSALAGTASIFVLYCVVRRLYSRATALASAFVLAVLPLHVTCSRYLKEDALLTLCVLLCTLAVVVAVNRSQRWMLLVAGFCAGLTAGTKYSGILMGVLVVASPWIVSRSLVPDRRWLLWAAAGLAVAPLGFLCTTPYALLNSARFLHDFAAESRHMSAGHTQSIDAWSQLWMYHFSRSILPGMTSITGLAAVAGLGFLVKRRRIEDLIVLGLFLLFYLPAEFVKAKPSPQPERYIVPCLPFLAAALGECWRVVATNLPYRRLGVLALALLVIVPGVRTVSLATEIPHDTRDLMADWMRANIPPGSKVLMDWQPYCPRFHNKEFEVEYIPRATIIPKMDLKYLRNSTADYLILSNLYYDRYFKQPESNPLLRQRIREVFERVPVKLQLAPKFGTYGFHNPVLTLFSLKQEDFNRLDGELLLKREGKVKETSNEALASKKW